MPVKDSSTDRDLEVWTSAGLNTTICFITTGGRSGPGPTIRGGIQGGISNGMDIYFRAAFKPVATIIPAQESVEQVGESVLVEGRGRHDPCVLPRAVPIVEAMSALVMADHWLRQRMIKL